MILLHAGFIFFSQYDMLKKKVDPLIKKKTKHFIFRGFGAQGA